MNLRRVSALIVILVLPAVFSFCGEEKGSAGGKKEIGKMSEPSQEGQSASGKKAIIKTRHGEIVIRLFPDVAPKHVASFEKLVSEGFFNGTIFHRVIPNFMIQGGDPLTKDPSKRQQYGTGGPGYTIPAEFSDRHHVRGTISAARSQDPNSAGSQFFICVAPASWLDGQYTVFGEVESGLEVVDKIVSEPRDNRDNPLDRVEMTITLE